MSEGTEYIKKKKRICVNQKDEKYITGSSGWVEEYWLTVSLVFISASISIILIVIS